MLTDKKGVIICKELEYIYFKNHIKEKMSILKISEGDIIIFQEITNLLA